MKKKNMNLIEIFHIVLQQGLVTAQQSVPIYKDMCLKNYLLLHVKIDMVLYAPLIPRNIK